MHAQVTVTAFMFRKSDITVYTYKLLSTVCAFYSHLCHNNLICNYNKFARKRAKAHSGVYSDTKTKASGKTVTKLLSKDTTCISLYTTNLLFERK